MKIRPLHDRVLLKRLDDQQETTSGIIIPDTAKEKPIQGEIVAVGNGKIQKSGEVRTLTVQPGDRVLYSKYAGTEVKLDGHEHLIMREDDILGILT
jgi:chaperonin GroES